MPTGMIMDRSLTRRSLLILNILDGDDGDDENLADNPSSPPSIRVYAPSDGPARGPLHDHQRQEDQSRRLSLLL